MLKFLISAAALALASAAFAAEPSADISATAGEKDWHTCCGDMAHYIPPTIIVTATLFNHGSHTFEELTLTCDMINSDGQPVLRGQKTFLQTIAPNMTYTARLAIPMPSLYKEENMGRDGQRMTSWNLVKPDCRVDGAVIDRRTVR